MNERIEELALDAGLLNYVDNETPRRCFIHGHADLEEVEKFAELIIQECAKIGEIKEQGFGDYDPNISVGWYMRKHFGVE
jgi:hypothetical protein